MDMTTKQLVDDLKETLDDLNEGVAEFESELDSITENLVRPARARIAAAQAQAVTSFEKYQAESGEEVGEALDDLDDALREFRNALAAATTDLAAESAPHLAGYRRAFDDQTAVWKGRFEHLALQADLARMDLRDDVLDLHDAYVDTRRTVRTEMIHAETAGRTRWENIRDRARDELDILGVNYNEVLDKIRRTP